MTVVRKWDQAETVQVIGDGLLTDAAHGVEPTARRRRVLIVDDNACVRETLAELLEVAGYAVVQAESADDAVALLRQDQAVDALVTDLSMPGDDGIALIRQARAIVNGLPAILLTGYAEQTTAVSAGAAGPFHVLRKPVESERLIAQLELLVGGVSSV